MRRLAMLALLALAACQSAPTDSQCDELVAHVIELELDAANAAAEARSDLSQKLEAEIGESTRTFCRSQLPRAQVECALAAKTGDELVACDTLGY